jgi:zinc protease
MRRWACSLAMATALGYFASCHPVKAHQPMQAPARDSGMSPVSEHRDDDAWRSQPRIQDVPLKFDPPRPQEVRLPSAVRVLVVENHETPLVSIRVIAPLGAADVPAGKQGLANVLAKMLVEGAGRRDAAALGRDLAKLGASIDIQAGLDGIFVNVQALADKLDGTLELLGDVLKEPRLDRATFVRVRKGAITEASTKLAEGRRAAAVAVKQGFLGQVVTEGFDPVGDEAGLSKIKLADVIAFHRSTFEPGGLAVVVAGDVTAAEVATKLETHLKGRSASPARRAPMASVKATRLPVGSAGRLILVDRPGAGQVEFSIGLDGIDRISRDWAAIQVMNHAFGGLYASRVNLLLREVKGYTYGFRSQLLCSRRFGQLSMRTAVRTEVAVATLDAITGEMARFLAEPPTQAEIDSSRRLLLTQAARRFITNEDTAAAFDDIVLYGLPLDTWNQDIRALEAVSTGDVIRVARRLLVRDRVIVAMVGPVAGMAEQLASRGLKIERRDL